VTLDASNIIQDAAGTTVSGTTHAVTLPGGTTAGNTIIVFGSAGSGLDTFDAPTGTGWVLDASNSVGAQVSRLSNVGAGATTWTFTTAGANVTAWYVAEVSGLDLVDPKDASITASAAPANGGTMSATTPMTAGRSTIAFAGWSTAADAGLTHTWSAWTNGFVERAEASGSGLQGMAVAFAAATDTQAWSTTATIATADPSSNAGAVIVAYREAGTPIVTPLFLMAGMEWGTHGGAGQGVTNGSLGLWNSSLAPTGTWGTNYLIQAGSARASAFGLRIVQAGAAAFVRFGTPSSSYIYTVGMNVRVVSATGVVVVSDLASQAQLVYDATATKFGVRAGTTGTIQYQPGTTALNTWVWVDLRVNTSGTTWRADWRIETAASTYTDQTQATLAGQTPSVVGNLLLGGNAAQTVTADYDDVVTSLFSAPYPLGPHQIRVLKVDPAGTPTLSGTTTNFQTFTANGTLAAWNATTARNNVDELPPTVSASADGLAQTTIAASDYVEFPMETYTLAAKEVIAGVRMYASMWATSAGGVCTVGLRGWQGSVETVLTPIGSTFSPGQPTAYSATAPVWRVAMWPSTGGWTQAELDAAAVRFGFATDVSPGVSAIYLEVATTATKTKPLFGTMATAEVDPNRAGIVEIDVTAPAMGTGDTSLVYEEAGSPTTVPVPAGTLVTEQIGAIFDEDVNKVTMVWPPEPDPVSAE
jgi:hypothetical protein